MDKEVNVSLGDFLEKLRGKIPLREVSAKSGLSHTYIRDLELGVNRKTKAPIRPTPETLHKLATAYNYSYDELMRMAGYIQDDQPEIQLPSENLLFKHLRDGTFDKTTGEERKKIKDQALAFFEFMGISDFFNIIDGSLSDKELLEKYRSTVSTFVPLKEEISDEQAERLLRFFRFLDSEE